MHEIKTKSPGKKCVPNTVVFLVCGTVAYSSGIIIIIPKHLVFVRTDNIFIYDDHVEGNEKFVWICFEGGRLNFTRFSVFCSLCGDFFEFAAKSKNFFMLNKYARPIFCVIQSLPGAQIRIVFSLLLLQSLCNLHLAATKDRIAENLLTFFFCFSFFFSLCHHPFCW